MTGLLRIVTGHDMFVSRMDLMHAQSMGEQCMFRYDSAQHKVAQHNAAKTNIIVDASPAAGALLHSPQDPAAYSAIPAALSHPMATTHIATLATAPAICTQHSR